MSRACLFCFPFRSFCPSDATALARHGLCLQRPEGHVSCQCSLQLQSERRCCCLPWLRPGTKERGILNKIMYFDKGISCVSALLQCSSQPRTECQSQIYRPVPPYFLYNDLENMAHKAFRSIHMALKYNDSKLQILHAAIGEPKNS